MRLMVSPSDSAQENLRLEEQLLTGCCIDTLLLYVNSPSVIVGRHQEPAAEADLDFCTRHNISVLRRVSGGGTVYHDHGNINYSFIVNRTATAPLDRDFLAPVLAMLRSLGLNAVQGRRNDITVEGLKISGTASHLTRQRHLFHGTLLYDTDLTALESALKGDSSLHGNRIASVPSPVANIRQLAGLDGDTEWFLGYVTDFMQNNLPAAIR